MLDRDGLIDLIGRQYFGAMDRKDLDGTMAPLAPDCVFTVYPAGERHAGRDAAIRPLFARAFEDYASLWHGNFNWVVDEPQQRVAAWFDVRLERPGGHVIEMSNGKFFSLAGDRLVRLDLYLSTAERIVGETG
ncbi:MAG TPA: nuclear transport factor 2 family protein [Alphaproteobacteria bacterium]|jgi:ketosteroid isomerase-like protein|nr:nuclear transport factor 2 family protein [Alphaproteobacteria bacterium]